MQNSDDVSRLLSRMKEESTTKSVSATGQSSQKSDGLPLIDVTPYKAADAWPGRNYALIGNSHYVERRIIQNEKTMLNKRAACISMMLAQGGGRRLVFVTEAMQYDGFSVILSRFEREWLNRMPPSTVLGPAYDSVGNLLEQSFAVWSCVKSPSQTRELAPV